MHFSPDRPPDDDLAELLRRLVTQALQHQRPEPVLRWIIDRAPQELPAVFAPVEPAAARRALALHLGLALWNAIPLPRLDYRPEPLPKPERNHPCPCGAGAKYKRCCGRYQVDNPSPPTELLLALVAALLAEEELPRLGASITRDPELLATVALEEDRAPRRRARLLEGALERLDRLDERHRPALQLLLTTYGELGWSGKREELLTAVLREARPELHGEAWLQRSGEAMDEGDIAGAREALDRARAVDREDSRPELLEVHLLVAEDRREEAAARARYLLAARRRQGLPDDTFSSEFLAKVADDDFEGLFVSRELRELVERFTGLLAAAVERPPVVHGPILVPGLDDDRPEATLEPPAALARLELDWHDEAWPLDQPFASATRPFDLEVLWSPHAADAWLTFLEEHPAALDSLSILGDLVQAAYQLGELPIPSLERTVWEPLSRRGQQIVDATLAAAPTARLRWGFAENRPGLRLLVQRAMLLVDSEPAEGAALIERLLDLDPEDNHGLRATLVDHRLRIGDDEGALAAAAHHEDDVLPEVLWGRVLAHYRRGDHGLALTALAEAHRTLPRVGAALGSTSTRAPRPDSPFGTVHDGEAQAWEYANAMRDVWASVPGLLPWLEKTRRGLPKGPLRHRSGPRRR